MKKPSEFASYGVEGHTNVFTGEHQTPIVMDWSKGGQNVHTIGTTGDTTTFKQSTSEYKDRLCSLLPEAILSSILTEEDIINVHLIERHKDTDYISSSDIRWFPTKAIYKLLSHYNIDYSDIK